MKSIHERIYTKLVDLLDIDELIQKKFLKFTSKGFMDLNVDYLRKDRNGNVIISLAHNYLQNGDVMCDPDMEVRIIPEMNMAEGLSFHQDGLPNPYQQVYTKENGQIHVNLKRKKDLNVFLHQWLTNIKNQGFKKEEGN